MSDVSITAGSVVPGSDAQIKYGVAAAAITAGQAVYLSSQPATYNLADCNSATAAVRVCAGIALNSAGTGQPVAVIYGGTYTAGGTLTAGKIYVLTDTPGGIALAAEIGRAHV